MTTPRVVRGPAPARRLTAKNYRKRAFQPLVRDFDGRCAYSMIHMHDAGGKYAVDIDHFNPKLKGDARHRYSNLMLSTRHCNLKKWKYWPNAADLAVGIRFLNPTVETDYGAHIFEIVETGELVGVSEAARYHINCLGLNDVYFKNQRLERTSSNRLLNRNFLFTGEALTNLQEDVSRMISAIQRGIPSIPACQPEHVLVQPHFRTLITILATLGISFSTPILNEIIRRTYLDISVQG